MKTATIKTNSLILNEEIQLLLTKVALLDHSVSHYLTIQAQGELFARCRNVCAADIAISCVIQRDSAYPGFTSCKLIDNELWIGW